MNLSESPVLETARLTLRRVQAADLPDLLRINGDDAVTRFLPYASWQSLADAQTWFDKAMARHDKGEALQLVMVKRESAQVIANCLVFNFDATDNQAETGYVMGQADWGHGYMAEAMTAVINYALNDLQIRRLEAIADARNTASEKLLLRLGFVKEGHLRERFADKGEVKDACLYGLLRADWVPHEPEPSFS